MSYRDASRVKIKLPEQHIAGTGTPFAVDAASDVYLCVTDGPTWSGFTRGDVETTCSNITLDGWGNLIRTFEPGKMINLGTLTFTVDWDPDLATGGREMTAFWDGRSGEFLVEFPANIGETAGPVITITGYVNKFTPMGTVLSEDKSARQSAEMSIKISGIEFTAPTV
jgi:hypothetical protein